jgi:small conductance mechanosensitive channel
MNVDISLAWRQVQAMVQGFIAMLPALILAIVVFAIFYMIAKAVRGFVRRFVKGRRAAYRNLEMVLGRLAQWGIIFLGGMIAVTIAFPTFSPGDLITVLGIGGVAIGFAFKDIFQNFLAGILILLTEPFRVGDQIIVGDFEGTVEEIQTRATFIKTYDGRRVVIPNSDLFTDKVLVNTAFSVRRSQYDIGIGYGDDVERAKEIILATLRGVDGVLQTPAPDVLTVELGASTVNLRARWWSESPRLEVLEVQDRVLTALKKRLTREGIDLPFDTHVVLFHDQTEETDGDRKRQREGWPAGGGEAPRPRTVPGALQALAGNLKDGAGGRG